VRHATYLSTRHPYTEIMAQYLLEAYELVSSDIHFSLIVSLHFMKELEVVVLLLIVMSLQEHLQ
jgi:hypothetical protein